MTKQKLTCQNRQKKIEKKRAQKKAQNTFRDPLIGTLRNPVKTLNWKP